MDLYVRKNVSSVHFVLQKKIHTIFDLVIFCIKKTMILQVTIHVSFHLPLVVHRDVADIHQEILSQFVQIPVVFLNAANVHCLV